MKKKTYQNLNNIRHSTKGPNDIYFLYELIALLKIDSLKKQKQILKPLQELVY